MHAVMSSSDHSVPAPSHATRRHTLLRAAGWLAGASGMALAPTRVPAQQRGEVTELRVESTDGGLLLSAAWRMELPALLENALYQGIALHFVAEAQLVRPRWYWSDKVVAHAWRYLRLSYQPLTRRWRLVQSSVDREASAAGASLAQSFDDAAEALAALQRIAGWKIADAAALEEGASYLVNFQFRLDTSQMPRPLQFGAVGRSNWQVSLTRRIELPPAEAGR